MRATRDTQLRESSKQCKLSQKDKLSRLLRASANEKKEHMNGLLEIKIFKILLLLPAESLHRSRFVCKAWFNLVNSSNFTDAHIRHSETVFIFLQLVSQRRPKTFSIEAKLVDGPSFGLFTKLIRKPVAAIGALHWLPAKHGCSYIVSLGIDDEKFYTRALSISSSVNDRLLEIGGFLSFVTHVTLNRIEAVFPVVVKRHIIMSNKITDLIPISTLRHGREMVFKGCRDGSFYVYDIEIQVMRKVEMEGEPHRHRSSYLPHVNTLASWESNTTLW
ncbi:hypothetical protein LOK49_LG08G01082 [Camellia lanceoleosa]|uniref:Uncharacterized protein n=1 Tax=Camellia lanceoleosa TaxID=1840588 RepID=A0ACC0GQN4_9ERIC|nr:hypothetical protein LOK49_LG08G01082 [Camellia lanceoleosa]